MQPEIIMIIVRWYINDFFRYIKIQVSDLSKSISDLMVNTHDLYTILEAEIIYYTPGQPGTQYYRLHPHKVNTRDKNSSLLMLC